MLLCGTAASAYDLSIVSTDVTAGILNDPVFFQLLNTFSREKLCWDFLLRIENVYGLDESDLCMKVQLKPLQIKCEQCFCELLI